MKIFLAAGFTVTNVPGKERELSYKFKTWRRLFSFFWMDAIIKSEILDIVKEHENNQIRLVRGFRDGKTRPRQSGNH